MYAEDVQETTELMSVLPANYDAPTAVKMDMQPPAVYALHSSPGLMQCRNVTSTHAFPYSPQMTQ